jgi:hypothetical protein
MYCHGRYEDIYCHDRYYKKAKKTIQLLKSWGLLYFNCVPKLYVAGFYNLEFENRSGK